MKCDLLLRVLDSKRAWKTMLSSSMGALPATSRLELRLPLVPLSRLKFDTLYPEGNFLKKFAVRSDHVRQ